MPNAPHTRIAVIMAGGSGERFWPLSRCRRPKQLLRLTSDCENLLEEAVQRIRPLIPPERVFIATTRQLEAPIREGRIGVPNENILAEPSKRNTAGCLCHAVARVMARRQSAVRDVSMAVLTADHLIPDHDRFRAAVESALSVAEREGAIAVMGVRPTRPETGYGYIEIPAGATPLSADAAHPRPSAFPVLRFREKPNKDTAEEFIATGRFYWNSGMFFWTLATFLREMRHASPAHAQATRQMAAAMRRRDEAEVERLFGALPDISIDYALMEKAQKVAMAPADFEWDDIGAWDSLDRTKPHDAHGNVAIGEPVLIDTRDCIVYNEPGAAQVAVAVVGVEDLAVIVSPDGVLVIPKERAQDVRKAVAALKQRGATQL